MPRIYTSTNDPIDFCKSCMPNEADAWNAYGMLGNGPDDRGNCYGYDAEHPPYHPSGYTCEKCRKRLDWPDDGSQ
jgi:hypothetical protein